MSVLAIPLFLLIGLGQLFLGYVGLELLLGTWAAIGGIVVAFMLRFMLPMTIGSYFGAVDFMGWPWWAGVLVVAPGIIFMIPAILAEIPNIFRRS